MARINDPKTGGTVDYYLIDVRHPRRQEAPCRIDVDDLSATLKPTPEEFNILKSIVRTCNARLGNGKPGYDDMDAAIRDAKKAVHYAQCKLRILENELKDMNQKPIAEDEWHKNPGYAPAEETVEVVFRSGIKSVRKVEDLDWRLSATTPIDLWKPVKD